MAPRSTYALEAEGLGKAYLLYGSPIKRITEALSFGKYSGHHEHWALRDIDLKLPRGASFGVCGANGAGKSTLLKVIAGTTAPTVGRYRINGRVTSLLELGAGFHPEFSGRANIVVNGVMMGVPKREIESRVDEIIDFAELGDYIDAPVRTYSSGMAMRLGFSVAVAVEPELMIIDEVFAVGDMYFQKKCIDRIYKFREAGRTIVFCSHSLYDMRQLCDEAIWLDDGQCQRQGDSVFVTNEYSAFQDDYDQSTSLLEDEFPPASDREERAESGRLPRILDARIYRSGTDQECYEVTTGDSLELRIWWENPDPDSTPIHIGVGVIRQDMTPCGGAGTGVEGVKLEGTGGCLVLELADLRLLSGQFWVPVVLLDGMGGHLYQEFRVQERLLVRTHTKDVGLFRMQYVWKQSPLPPPAEKLTREKVG